MSLKETVLMLRVVVPLEPLNFNPIKKVLSIILLQMIDRNLFILENLKET